MRKKGLKCLLLFFALQFVFFEFVMVGVAVWCCDPSHIQQLFLILDIIVIFTINVFKLWMDGLSRAVYSSAAVIALHFVESGRTTLSNFFSCLRGTSFGGWRFPNLGQTHTWKNGFS